MTGPFFIVGFVRSGSTALARALNTASNAEVSVEIAPKLLVESRLLREGKLADPVRVLRAARLDPIRGCAARGKVFGDKSAAYLPFLPHLIEALDGRIVFFHRDGRDAVRSLMDWHAFKANNIYIRAEDEPGGHDHAPEADAWSYAYLRPLPGDPLARRWRELSRFEKCAWYWAEYNRFSLDHLDALPPARVRTIDLTRCTAADLSELFTFLGLDGYDEAKVATVMGARVNSLEDRTGIADSFPHWRDWSTAQHAAFAVLAGPMMARLGYG